MYNMYVYRAFRNNLQIRNIDVNEKKKDFLRVRGSLLLIKISTTFGAM